MKKAEYKQTNNKVVYPRNEWKCECGFIFVLMEGFNPDWNSSEYGATVIPDGKCMKCKGMIFVDTNSIKDTRSFKR